MEQVIVHANDTDVTVLIMISIYYYAACLRELGLQKLWIRTQLDSCLSIHKMADRLGGERCYALSLIHSLSGRDVTSYPYFKRKGSCLAKSKLVELDKTANCAENDFEVTASLIDQVKKALPARLPAYLPASPINLLYNILTSKIKCVSTCNVYFQILFLLLTIFL